MVTQIQSLTINPAFPGCSTKFNERKMKGKAIPSLQPDSADKRFLKWPGTLCANLPETTDCAKIGSVAVTQAATNKLAEKLK